MAKTIPWRVPNTQGKLPEFMLLEFQGEFEHSFGDVSFDSLPLGDLLPDPRVKDVYSLCVSNHLLKGKQFCTYNSFCRKKTNFAQAIFSDRST